MDGSADRDETSKNGFTRPTATSGTLPLSGSPTRATRPSDHLGGRLHVSRDPDGTNWVGGGTVTCVSGEVAL